MGFKGNTKCTCVYRITIKSTGGGGLLGSVTNVDTEGLQSSIYWTEKHTNAASEWLQLLLFFA